MSDEVVRVSRPPDQEGVLLMAGRTTQCLVEPRGEYVFGLVTEGAMNVRRSDHRDRVAAGQLVLWDPSAAHTGTAADGQPWSSRLMVLEVATLTKFTKDEDSRRMGPVEFPRPVTTDAALASAFSALLRALDGPSTLLEQDERLMSWLNMAVARYASRQQTTAAMRPRDDRAVDLALEVISEGAERNFSLNELAAASGIGKFRLIRLVRERTGLTPHALQIACRVRQARRLLEAGEPIADTALAVGFTDQSHLHRHFRRTLGMTPAQYQTHFGVQRRV